MFKLLIPALFFALITQASLQPDMPKEDYDNICKPVVTKFVSSLLASKTLSIDEGIILEEKNANEKRVAISKMKADKAKYTAVYSAVNRQIGFNMEGEWRLTVSVSTELSMNERICNITNASFTIDRPKANKK
jgi:hypothetical protein